MRMMSLFIIFLVALYNFIPREPSERSIDSVKIKLSAQKKPEVVRKTVIEKIETAKEEVETVSVEDQSDADFSAPEEEAVATAEENVPWDEIQKGWEAEVKEALIRLEPEDGETIYNSYLAEKENHQAEIDALFADNRSMEKSRTPSVVPTEVDEVMTQLDQKHEERLKEILGSHFDEISKKHQEYQESIQHLSHDNGDLQIGISL
jgi:RNA processing factor Prp31